MFGIGMQELMIILVVALLVLGPTKLPSVARTLGKGLRELRKASDDLRTAVMVDLDEDRSRRVEAPPPSELPAKEDLEPAIQGSLAASGEAVRAEGASTDEAEAAAQKDDREDSLVRAAPGIVPRGKVPDPNDADDHSGMPYAPDGPEVAQLLDEAKAKAAESQAAESKGAEPKSADGPPERTNERA